MLRGVNRQIIEVNDIENPFFERAILFVRPDCREESDRDLRGKAVDWLNTAGPSALRPPRRRKRRLSRRALWLFLWVAAGAAAVLGILYIAR